VPETQDKPDIFSTYQGTNTYNWNNSELLKQWRAAWAQYANEALEKAGSKARIDHRSLAAQGSTKQPTVHIGLKQSQDDGLHEQIQAQNQQITDFNKERETQPKLNIMTAQQFRSKLIEVYGGKCAISGSDVEQVLETAHITPYHATTGDKANTVENGLLLRSDIQKLFEAYQIVIHPKTKVVRIAPDLKNTIYKEFDGAKLQLPIDESYQPKEEFLEKRYKRCKWLKHSDEKVLA
jgi:predicted restriction endonuclease